MKPPTTRAVPRRPGEEEEDEEVDVGGGVGARLRRPQSVGQRGLGGEAAGGVVVVATALEVDALVVEAKPAPG